MPISDRPCGSFLSGTLPRGCEQCTEGAKMVLFVTGLCPFHCFYCPVSDEKMYRDGVYADEKRVLRDEDVLEEARAIRAKGVGITGGDPLEAVERTCHYLRLLKKEFGPTFHAHLYTMTTDPAKIRALAEAGLDELRLHVPPGLWARTSPSGFTAAARQARNLGMTVGVEVPLLPEREEDLVKLIAWAESEGLAFVNLDEMEFSDSNYARMSSRGYAVKHELSHGVQGADEVARRLLGHRWEIPVHYCSSGYKDGWQLRTRIQRRAESVAKPWDVVTEDGTLIKGVIEGSDLPEFFERLRVRHRVPADLMHLDAARSRIEVAPWILEKIAGRLGRAAYVVEEYPTADRLQVERVRLP